MEYGFVLTNLGAERSLYILDVGCGGSLFPIMMASLGHKVYGLDLGERPKVSHPNFRFIKGNIKRPPTNVACQKFDVITAISTLEHIGLSPSVDTEIDENGDLHAMDIMASLLKKNGKILITIPYGKKSIKLKLGFDYFRVYDDARLNKLVKHFKLKKICFFVDIGGAWFPIDREKARLFVSAEDNVVRSIACLVLSIDR